MRAGISTACLYPMLLEKSFSTLISMDFHLFEIFINTCSELKKEYIKELKRMAEESGSIIKSVHPFTSGYESFLLFSNYERRFEDGLEFYKNYFQACNILGASILVLHGKKIDKCNNLNEENYFEHYARLFELGKNFGVTVAQENVNLLCSDNPTFIQNMRKYCGGNCAFVLDIKQAVRGGVDPLRLCAAMGERIVHIHINDNNPVSDCLLPGFGNMDYNALLRLLKSFGYDGDLIIEVYSKSFSGLPQITKAKTYVEKLVKAYNEM